MNSETDGSALAPILREPVRVDASGLAPAAPALSEGQMHSLVLSSEDFVTLQEAMQIAASTARARAGSIVKDGGQQRRQAARISLLAARISTMCPDTRSKL